MAEKTAWLQNLSYSAEDDRRLITALLEPSAAFKPISGVFPSQLDGQLKVVQRAAGVNMSVDVGTGQAVVAGTENADQGGYIYTNTATVNLTLTAANATNPRIDAIIVRAKDSVYSGALNSVALEVVAGTPAASPAAPTLPANSLLLANVTVPANDTTISNDQIRDMRAYAQLKGQGTNLAFRNRIRNGDFSIGQRGAGSFTANGYGVDGVYLEKFGAGTLSLQPAANAPNDWIGGYESRRALIATVSGQSLTGDGAMFWFPIESVSSLAGQVATLSFGCKLVSGTAKLAVELSQIFGTGGAPSASVSTPVGQIQLAAGWKRYSITFTVPSVAGKTLGNNADALWIGIWISAGATFATRASGIGIQNIAVTFDDVQLEAGAIPTPFERIPQEVQLAWCQRYFEAMPVTVMTASTNFFFKVTKRGVPTISGGGAGFTATLIQTDTLLANQTGQSLQTLLINAEL
jgi:hypothetical protein